jgi:hypothetical protein
VPFTKTFNPGEILTASDVNDFLLNGGYQYRQTVYYTSSGTFVKADYPWLRAIRVKVVGGGGGSGGCVATGANQLAAGGAGAGGGYAEKFITDIAGLSASETITRGGGGAGGAAGNNAGTNGSTSSAFGVSATGGAGGAGSTTFSISNFFPSVRSGGVGSGGDLNINGDNTIGAFAFNDSRVNPGIGGRSFLSGNISESVAEPGVGERLAQAGRAFGGGALGPTKAQNTATNRAGAAGGDGIVIVDLFG